MKNDEQQRVLAARARTLAARQTETSHRQARERVFVVQVGDRRIGIEHSHMQEVVPAVPVTPLSGVPAGVQGVASLRGELLAAADLALLLGRDTMSTGKLFAVVKSDRGALALRIDAVVEVREIFDDDLAKSLQFGGDGDRVLRAVTNDLAGLLDIQHIMTSEALVTPAAMDDGATSDDQGAHA